MVTSASFGSLRPPAGVLGGCTAPYPRRARALANPPERAQLRGPLPSWRRSRPGLPGPVVGPPTGPSGRSWAEG
ncbi:hypothetical protein [Ornithinimicrobium kibberense]|uniref:hypothetical protein n=1 Tax=Ornithinimicrobium kibberense TaxID=282060 RepID=UPI0036156FB2